MQIYNTSSSEKKLDCDNCHAAKWTGYKTSVGMNEFTLCPLPLFACSLLLNKQVDAGMCEWGLSIMIDVVLLTLAGDVTPTQYVEGLLNYNVPPNSCTVVQMLHTVPGHGRITSRINILSHHKLYREDTVFLYPSPMYRTYLKLQQKFTEFPNVTLSDTYDHVLLSYYHGTLLSMRQTFGGNGTNQNMSIYLQCTNEYHLVVEFPRAIVPIFVETRAVEFAYGSDVNVRMFATLNFEAGPMAPRASWVLGSQSWVSSTIYHINCQFNITYNTSHWAWKKEKQIIEACKVQGTKFYTNPRTAGYSFMLKPPSETSRDDGTSVVWTLLLSLQNISLLVEDESTPVVGEIHFKTYPTKQFCNKTKVDPIYRWNILFKFDQVPIKPNKTCVCFQSTTSIHRTLLKKDKTLALGYRIFQYTSLKFLMKPSFKLETSDKAPSAFISYNWKANKYSLSIHHTLIKTIKILNFTTEYSWSMAAYKCKRQGMLLPHMKDEKSTLELALFLLDNYVLQTYALFVGLLKKVGWCLFGCKYTEIK